MTNSTQGIGPDVCRNPIGFEFFKVPIMNKGADTC